MYSGFQSLMSPLQMVPVIACPVSGSYVVSDSGSPSENAGMSDPSSSLDMSFLERSNDWNCDPYDGGGNGILLCELAIIKSYWSTTSCVSSKVLTMDTPL